MRSTRKRSNKVEINQRKDETDSFMVQLPDVI